MSRWENDTHALRTKAEELMKAGSMGWIGTSSTWRAVDGMHYDAAMALFERANQIDRERVTRTL